MKLGKLPRELFGCGFGGIGILFGRLAALNYHRSHIEALRSIEPNLFECGFEATSSVLPGIFVGGLVGIVVGLVVHRSLYRNVSEINTMPDSTKLSAQLPK